VTGPLNCAPAQRPRCSTNARARSPSNNTDDGVYKTGESFSFAAPDDACAVPPCTYDWTCEVTDPAGGDPVEFTATGETITITTGAGGAYDVDMTGVTDSRDVSCVATVTDADDNVVDTDAFTATVDPAAPVCDTVASPKSIVEKLDNCKAGNQAKYKTILVTSFTDPQGITVTINITAVTTNQLTANCNNCNLRQRRRFKKGKKLKNNKQCTCAPAAELTPSRRSACIIPDVASGRGTEGRLYRIYYTATSTTGLSCTGVAKVCVGGVLAARRKKDGLPSQNWVGINCADVASASAAGGYGAMGGAVGVQCARPNPARLVCTEDSVTYDALTASCVKAGRGIDLRRAKRAAAKNATATAKAKKPLLRKVSKKEQSAIDAKAKALQQRTATKVGTVAQRTTDPAAVALRKAEMAERKEDIRLKAVARKAAKELAAAQRKAAKEAARAAKLAAKGQKGGSGGSAVVSSLLG